jgi:hypothetical protein
MIRKVHVLWIGIVTAFCFAGPLPFAGRSLPGPSVSLAQEEGWRGEYDSVCSKTDVAMTLSAEELRALIVRCDRLKPRIEAEEESTRKVYLRRLQMCRDLYRYVLESKETK